APSRAPLRRPSAATGPPVLGGVGEAPEPIRGAVAAVCPTVPQRWGQSRALRDAAGPLWEGDRHPRVRAQTAPPGLPAGRARPARRGWRRGRAGRRAAGPAPPGARLARAAPPAAPASAGPSPRGPSVPTAEPAPAGAGVLDTVPAPRQIVREPSGLPFDCPGR